MDRHPYLLLAVATLCSGIAPALVRMTDLDASAIAFWRLALTLIPAWLLIRRLPPMPRRDVGLALLAGVMLALDLVLWFGSIRRTTMLEATLLVMIYPLLVAAAAVIWEGQKLGASLIGGFALCFAGMVAMSGITPSAGSDAIGNGMALAAAAAYAVCYMLLARLSRQHNVMLVTFWLLAGAAVGALPAALAFSSSMIPPTAADWGLLALQAGLSLLSYIASNSAFRRLPTALAAVTGYGQPIIATGIAWVAFAERPGIMAITGAVIIGVGVWLTSRPGRTRAEPVTATE